MNKFTIDYDNHVLTLEYNDQVFMWSYTKAQGDLGDYWNHFVTKDSKVWDINLYQEEATDNPLLSVYPCNKDADGNYEIDTRLSESIPCLLALGNAVNFYNQYYN